MGTKAIIMTHTGKLMDALNPSPDNVCIEDIAHALTNICRFTGHVSRHYSVAEHCIHASYLGLGDPLICLLHDAAEAYIGDVASPFKAHTYVGAEGNSYSWLESQHQDCIGIALGVTLPGDPLLSQRIKEESKLADKIMLVAEASLLLPTEGSKTWQPYFNAVITYEQEVSQAEYRVGTWVGVSAEEIKHEFLRRFSELHYV